MCVPAELVVIEGLLRTVSNMAVRQFREGGDWCVRQGKNLNENLNEDRLDRELHLERPSSAVQAGNTK